MTNYVVVKVMHSVNGKFKEHLVELVESEKINYVIIDDNIKELENKESAHQLFLDNMNDVTEQISVLLKEEENG